MNDAVLPTSTFSLLGIALLLGLIQLSCCLVLLLLLFLSFVILFDSLVALILQLEDGRLVKDDHLCSINRYPFIIYLNLLFEFKNTFYYYRFNIFLINKKEVRPINSQPKNNTIKLPDSTNKSILITNALRKIIKRSTLGS